MSRRQSIFVIGIGVWASGMLVGANAIGYLAIKPSWPTWLLLIIGIVASLGNLAALYHKAKNQTESDPR